MDNLLDFHFHQLSIINYEIYTKFARRARRNARNCRVKSAEELFRSIPSDVQLNRALNITEPLAEPEVIGAMERLAATKYGGDETFVFGRGRLFAFFADDC